MGHQDVQKRRAMIKDIGSQHVEHEWTKIENDMRGESCFFKGSSVR